MVQGRLKPTWKIHEKKGGKKSESVNEDTPGEELCGEGKENGGIAGDKLRETKCFFKMWKFAWSYILMGII